MTNDDLTIPAATLAAALISTGKSMLAADAPEKSAAELYFKVLEALKQARPKGSASVAGFLA